MVDFSMFGPEQSGGRLFEQDSQKAMLAAAQGSNFAASTRLHTAQSNKLEQDAVLDRKLAEALSGGEMEGTPAEQAAKLSKLAYQSGSAAKGMDFAARAGLMQAREAASLHSEMSARKAQLEGNLKVMERASSLYDGVDSQEAFDKANAQYAYLFGTASPATGLPYSPELVGKLKDFGMTQAQKHKAALDELETDSRNANRESAIDFRTFRKGVLGQDAELRAAREERLAKAGGSQKGVANPSVAERELAKSLIKEEFPDLAERKEELGPVAYAVASRAKALQRANRALDSNTAVRQAFAEEKAAGNFQQVDGAWKAFTALGANAKKTTYGAPKAEVPLTMPKTAAEAKDGATYQTSRGPAKWNAKTQRMVPITPTVTPTSLPAALDDNEEETDE